MDSQSKRSEEMAIFTLLYQIKIRLSVSKYTKWTLYSFNLRNVCSHLIYYTLIIDLLDIVNLGVLDISMVTIQLKLTKVITNANVSSTV